MEETLELIPGRRINPSRGSAYGSPQETAAQLLFQGKSRRNDTKRKVSNEEIRSVAYMRKTDQLAAGTAGGMLLLWPSSVMKANDQIPEIAIGAHNGPIYALEEVTEDSPGMCTLLASAGSDMRIHLWDMRPKDGKDSNGQRRVQTLCGHQGTITAMQRVGMYILSASKDGTVRAWREKEKRNAFFYPWFVAHCILGSCEGWCRSLSFGATQKMNDSGKVFVGDSEGYLYLFNAFRDLWGRSEFSGAHPQNPSPQPRPLMRVHGKDGVGIISLT